MEDVPVAQDLLERAELEECRARQSECVNVQALRLHERLVALLGHDFAAATTSTTVAGLSPEVVEALVQFLDQYEEEAANTEAAIEQLEMERQHSLEKTVALAEKCEKVRSESAYLSEKNSANLKEFRQQLQQSGEAAKERNRELAMLNRKREKAEMDNKRTNMEIERLRKISKRAK